MVLWKITKILPEKTKMYPEVKRRYDGRHNFKRYFYLKGICHQKLSLSIIKRAMLTMPCFFPSEMRNIKRKNCFSKNFLIVLVCVSKLETGKGLVIPKLVTENEA